MRRRGSVCLRREVSVGRSLLTVGTWRKRIGRETLDGSARRKGFLDNLVGDEDGLPDRLEPAG